jgi:hypothetical protein
MRSGKMKKYKIKRQIIKTRLENDGCWCHLPFIYLNPLWKSGQRVRITIESLETRTVAVAKRGK